jgi:undecaprenyl diphosphate synthase
MKGLDLNRMPKHVAIILDGNRRWARQHGLEVFLGHKKMVDEGIDQVVDHAIKRGITYLTLWAFSTENWKRPQKEIYFLFNLLENFLLKKIDSLIKNKIKLKFIGEKQKLPIKLRKLIKISEQKTSQNNKLQINLALNYGSKNEILNAMRCAVKKYKKLNIKNIEQNLYTNGIPDPEILIRTGNTKRLSNFLLWQLAYTEIFFEKKLLPDFN